MSAGTEYHEREDCRICGSRDLLPYLDLGAQPPSNAFLRPEDVEQERAFPLEVWLCRRCHLSQLTGVVSARSLFCDYLYHASTSKALVRHYQGMIDELVTRFEIAPESAVVDVGCNDGITLDRYPDAFARTIGVEPSNVADRTEEKGHHVYRDFFGPATAERILADHGPAQLITATNVFAHVDDIHGFTAGVARLLGTGAFVIETPYVVDMVEGHYFDTIYHEHLCYYGLTPIAELLARHGLEVFDVERVAIGASGPAIRVYAQRRGGRRRREVRVEAMLANEASWGIGKPERYLAFARHIHAIRSELLELLGRLRATGARIGGYGAPAKGNTLLNTFGLRPDDLAAGIAETSAAKQGLLTPGTHLRIVSEQAFLEELPEYALLLAWNYVDFFLESSEYVRRGGRFIVPLPEVRIRPARSDA